MRLQNVFVIQVWFARVMSIYTKQIIVVEYDLLLIYLNDK